MKLCIAEIDEVNTMVEEVSINLTTSREVKLISSLDKFMGVRFVTNSDQL